MAVATRLNHIKYSQYLVYEVIIIKPSQDNLIITIKPKEVWENAFQRTSISDV